MFDFLGRAGKPETKWRSRAMLIDLHTTKITLELADKSQRMPPWMFKRVQQSHSV